MFYAPHKYSDISDKCHNPNSEILTSTVSYNRSHILLSFLALDSPTAIM